MKTDVLKSRRAHRRLFFVPSECSKRLKPLMNSSAKSILIPPLAMALAVSMAFTPVAYTPPAYAQNYASGQNHAAFTQQELDQMLAPIALYPDPLLSQILMASTYPLEV